MLYFYVAITLKYTLFCQVYVTFEQKFVGKNKRIIALVQWLLYSFTI